MIGACRYLTLLGWTTASLYGQSYCSLIVKVVLPDGPEVDALVRVEEANGHATEKENQAGGVRFCDLGISPVTVTVGQNRSCNQVIVRNVPLTWESTYVLKITYDRRPCLHDLPPPPVPICEVLFRVADTDGNWVSGAMVEMNDGFPARKADEFGRVFLVMKVGTSRKGIVTADRYSATQVTVSCNGDRRKFEQQVVLKERSGGR